MFKKIILALMLVVLQGCQTLTYTPVSQEQRKEGAHPHFNDGGTLYWYTDSTFEDALKQDKLIIIEYGRRSCKSCKIFVEKTLPQFKEQLGDNYVGVASDCDNANTKILEYIKKYASDATTLPIVIVLDKSRKCVGAVYGNIKPKEFADLISKAK